MAPGPTPLGSWPRDSYYFFLSYARVPPSESTRSPRDPLVDTFFEDLVTRVRRFASDRSRGIGLYDQSLPDAPAITVSDDWGQAIRRALSRAEVLVTLYSPRYISGSWTTREKQSFAERIRAAHDNPARRIQPVLWMPLPRGEPAPTEAIADIGDDVPQYQELGLGVLCDIARDEEPRGSYRKAYDTVVKRLARRIVDVAEKKPIGPSEVPGFAEGQPTPDAADFVIAVHAATADRPPAGRGAAAYGDRPADWSPFHATRPTPVVRQAIYVAQRLDVAAAVVEVADALTWQHKPGVLLVDAWQADDPAEAERLRALGQGLPPWVVPLVITDKHDGEDAARAEHARRRAVAMLTPAGSGREPTVADGFEGFMDVMPIVITRAWRRFFREMPSAYPSRPRLGAVDSRDRDREADHR